MISIYKDFDNPPADLLGDNPKITKAVKQALYDLYHGKCAYTEQKVPFEEMEIMTFYQDQKNDLFVITALTEDDKILIRPYRHPEKVKILYQENVKCIGLVVHREM